LAIAKSVTLKGADIHNSLNAHRVPHHHHHKPWQILYGAIEISLGCKAFKSPTGIGRQSGRNRKQRAVNPNAASSASCIPLTADV
jgi:hypothetical protein